VSIGIGPPRFVVRALVAVLTIGTFFGAFVVAHELFPDRSPNNDEAVYVYQAEILRSGHLTLPVDANTDFVRPWMSGTHDGHLVMVFQPVFPAVLALSDLLFGSMRVAVALIAAACIPLAYRLTTVLLDDERAGVVAAVLFAASPLVIVHSGLYLEYLFAVALEMGVLLLVAGAVPGDDRRDARPIPAGRGRTARLTFAGLLHGVLFFTRPLEAIVLGIVVVVYLALARRPLASVARSVRSIIVGALPIVVLCLAYNAATTGNPLRFPLWATGGDNAFGFGPRKIAAGSPVTDFRLHDAWFALRVNLRAFPHWFAGGLVSIGFAAYGTVQLWRAGRRSVVLTLAALSVLVPLAYFSYWGNLLIAMRGRSLFGPHYYLALLIPAVVVTSAGIVDVARRGRHLAVGAMAIALVFGSGIEVGAKVDANQQARDRISEELEAVRDTVDARSSSTDAAPVADAVVIVPAGRDGAYLMHPRGAMGNHPSLRGPLLYAVDLQARNNDLPERFPGRTLYRFQRVDDADGSHADVVALTRRRELGYRPRISLENVSGQPVVVLYAGVVGRDMVSCVLDRNSAVGRQYRPSSVISAGEIVLQGCENGDVVVPLPRSGCTLALGAAYGPTPDSATALADEQRLWLLPRPQLNDRVDLLTPPDTWHRGPGGAFRVTAPDDELRIAYDAL
jgi:hypothetical protein